MNHTINFSSSFFNISTDPTIDTVVGLNMHDIIRSVCDQYSSWVVFALWCVVLINLMYYFWLNPKYDELRKDLFPREPMEILILNFILVGFVLATMIL